MDKLKEVAPDKVVKVLTYLAFFLTLFNVSNHVRTKYLFLSSSLVMASYYFDMKRLYPPRLLLNVLSISVLFFSIMSVNIENVLDQGVNALILLTAIKFLENKRFRDYLQIYVLTLLLFSSKALFAIDLGFLFQMFILFFLLSTSVLLLTLSRETAKVPIPLREFKTFFFFSFLIFTLSIAMGFGLFFVLPRTEYPLFSFLDARYRAKTGIKEHIALGTYERIQEDQSIVFRVKMEKLEDEYLYWRGLVLDHFDGKNWVKRRISKDKYDLYQGGRLLKQTIFIDGEPPYIFALDKPVALISKEAKGKDDYSFALLDFRGEKIRYEVLSELTPVIKDDTKNLKDYLQLPYGLSPKIRAVAKDLCMGLSSDREKIEKIYNFLTSGEYSYSLDDLPVGEDAIERFLFEKKKGNCEFFASAFAIMLRVVGVPSRIVVGFKGGEYSEIGKYYLVRNRDAHSWVEAYVSGVGWVRYDPTPSPSSNVASKDDPLILSRAFMILDLVNYYWLVFFINYDLEKQINLLNTVESSLIRRVFLDLKKKDFIFVLITALFGLASIFVTLNVISILRIPKEKRLVLYLTKKLKKLGYTRKTNEGLEHMAERIKEPKIRTHALQIVREIEMVVYKDQKFTNEGVKKIKDMIKRMEKAIPTSDQRS